MNNNTLRLYATPTIRFVKFGLLSFMSVPSVACSCFVLYSFMRIRSLRQKFRNQMAIILLILGLFTTIVELPITLSFFARGNLQPRDKRLCAFWTFVGYLPTAMINWCMSIFTIERYVLIFYPARLNSLRQKLFIHYIPLGLSGLYLIVFYAYTIFIHKCDVRIRYARPLCGALCLEGVPSLSMFNWLFNTLLPVFVTILGSIGLLGHVLWQRRKMQQNLQNWSKNWKMTVQLMGIAIVYIIVWLPVGILSLIQMKFSDFAANLIDYFYDAHYGSEMSIPFAALFLFPEIYRRLRGQVRPHGNRPPITTFAQQSTTLQ